MWYFYNELIGRVPSIIILLYEATRSWHNGIGEAYPIQYYVIKFVSDLRQVDGFLRVLRIPPPIKLTATI
jgi:hypothetical protein